MNERRIYSRIGSGIACLIYSGNRESLGLIDNISETGLALRIEKKNDGQEFRLGDTIMATGLDTEDVLQFELEIMRVEETEDYILIGAHIVNGHDVEPYVHEKKLELLKKIYLKNRQQASPEDEQ